mgnify:CR=1 FL=1
MLVNTNQAGTAIAKGFRGMCKSIRALENAYRQSLVVEEGELLTDAEDDDYSLPRLPHTATSLAEDKGQQRLEDYIDVAKLPKHLGGELELGESGRCLRGVVHPPISATLGRAAVLRTISDVSEIEIRSVGDLIVHLTEECAVDLGSLPSHVGGEYALLSKIRAEKGDVGAAAEWVVECLRLRKEVWNADAAFAKIIDRLDQTASFII